MQELSLRIADLFNALAEGAGAQNFAAWLVSSLEGSDVRACVYEDRDGLGSVLLAGRKPTKMSGAKHTYTLQVFGSDRAGSFNARLRVIITGELSVEWSAELDIAVKECARRVKDNTVQRAAIINADGDLDSKECQQMPTANYVVRWGILAASTSTLRLLDEIEMYGPERAPVLITGETGTGKERVAQALHEVSSRKGRLVAVNCGCVAPDLIESLLFGYVRGSFTGASGDKKGYFEEADGGTIFLDEIGDMPLKAQVALLRVLQERKIRRLGDINERRVDVRVVAATHCNLERMVSEGAFRRDLYYRLRGLTIHIPALRERRAEIQPLTDYFLYGISGERGRRFSITERARKILLANTWKGNIRELLQCLEAAAVRAKDGIIDLDALMLPIEQSSDYITPVAQIDSVDLSASRDLAAQARLTGRRQLQVKSYSEMMDEYEKSLLQATLDACGGNVSRAAVMLKMSAITLRRRIRILGVERKTTLPPLLFAERGQPFQLGEVTSANIGD